jgi:hypothetical protein
MAKSICYLLATQKLRSKFISIMANWSFEVALKMRIVAVLMALASVAWCDNSLTRQERKEGFELLFDGKSLAKWHSIRSNPNAGSWHARKRVLSYDPGESWLATDETYYDFVLRLEYRTGEASDSGVFLRAAPKGAPGRTGMEVQILNDAGTPPRTVGTGSVADAIAPSKNMANPPGEWNQLEISALRRQLSVTLNGEKIIDANLDDPRYAGPQEPPLAKRGAYGHIGLQAHAKGAPVEFRNIRVKAVRIGPGFAPEQ